MVNIEIDGKKVKAPEGSMVIEAADEAGVYIPRFCYHKKLSIAANCRMCLVEVEKAAKALPACATPVTEGMKVFTRSPNAIAAQKAIMEFLLINHPLDCPICDQGGECELQDIAMGYGRDVSGYTEKKRVVKDKNLGALISTDMTRCIHCTRCVRFGDEIAGVRELGATGRGEHMEIGTYIQQSLVSEMSGNVIDLCPVGALTSKPFRFTARAWELVQRDGIAPHDAIGSNVHLHLQHNKIMRVVPKDNEEINETWISDRDRFSYEALESQDRLTQPMIKLGGVWQTTDWQTALVKTAEGLKQIIAQHGAEQLGVIASPGITVEEAHLLQKLTRTLGSNNIDHRLRQTDFSDQDQAPVFPWLGQSIQDLEHNDAVLLIGSNIRKDQPIAGHRLRKATLNGGQVMCVNPVDYDFHFNVAQKIICHPLDMARELAGIAQALSGSGSSSTAQQAIAEALRNGEMTSILLGPSAINHPQFAAIRSLAAQIAKETNSRLGYLPEGANSAGACLAGVLPHRGAGGDNAAKSGLNCLEMLDTSLKAYVLFGVEPELDCAAANSLQILQQADFTVAMSAFRSARLEAVCDVMLPISAFAETSGTFVNAEGRWQSFNGVAVPPGETRPGWKVLRVLGNLLECAGFDYVSSEQVRDELQTLTKSVQPDNRMSTGKIPALNGQSSTWMRIADVSIYSCDSLVRRAIPLQATNDAAKAVARLNRMMANQLSVTESDRVSLSMGSGQLVLPVVIDEKVPNYSVLVHAGLPETASLGQRMAPITINKAS